MPYLDLGEFYSEFGDFDVRINVPAQYIVAATGELKSESIADTTKTLIYQQNMVHDFAWFANKNFIVQKDSEIRQGNDFRKFTYVGILPILIEGEAFWDASIGNSFRIF